MISILIRNFSNKTYQIIRDLSDERNIHIKNNLETLNKLNSKYTISDSDYISETDLKKAGFVNDPALYDRDVIEYNNNPCRIGSALKAWIR